ncbi:hypothetical protein TNCV_3395151 [Trichonephila clavipes]|nr:hypothetical protein TNCV_3395151 [Trichonephila clavipes]
MKHSVNDPFMKSHFDHMCTHNAAVVPLSQTTLRSLWGGMERAVNRQGPTAGLESFCHQRSRPWLQLKRALARIIPGLPVRLKIYPLEIEKKRTPLRGRFEIAKNLP